jgi:hypothetical protein
VVGLKRVRSLGTPYSVFDAILLSLSQKIDTPLVANNKSAAFNALANHCVLTLSQKVFQANFQ